MTSSLIATATTERANHLGRKVNRRVNLRSCHRNIHARLMLFPLDNHLRSPVTHWQQYATRFHPDDTRIATGEMGSGGDIGGRRI